MLTIYRTSAFTVAPIVIAGLVGVLGAAPAAASTVVRMSLKTLADHAGQVIVGRVSAVQSDWVDVEAQRPQIETEVTFEQVEYLKGALPDAAATFTLTVPGGAIGELRMQVCCAPAVEVGDKWVLFLLPHYRTFPVVGLYQGAFLVQPDDEGVERIYRRRHNSLQPVTGFDADGFVRTAPGEPDRVHKRLVAAHGVRLNGDLGSGKSVEAMTYDALLAEIRPVVAASRAYTLTRPAGQRILVAYAPASLQISPKWSSSDGLGRRCTPRQGPAR